MFLILSEVTKLLEIALFLSLKFAVALLVPADDSLGQEHIHWLILQLFDVGVARVFLGAPLGCMGQVLLLLAVLLFDGGGILTFLLVHTVSVEVGGIDETVDVGLLTFLFSFKLFKFLSVHITIKAWL